MPAGDAAGRVDRRPARAPEGLVAVQMVAAVHEAHERQRPIGALGQLCVVVRDGLGLRHAATPDRLDHPGGHQAVGQGIGDAGGPHGVNEAAGVAGEKPARSRVARARVSVARRRDRTASQSAGGDHRADERRGRQRIAEEAVEATRPHALAARSITHQPHAHLAGVKRNEPEPSPRHGFDQEVPARARPRSAGHSPRTRRPRGPGRRDRPRVAFAPGRSDPSGRWRR